MIRKPGAAAMVVLTTFLFCGATDPQGCQTQNLDIGPSEGEVIGAGVAVVAVLAVGTVVLVEVHKGHHTIKGCVVSGPNGLELETADKKMYALSGDTLRVKTGDIIQMHGNKIKRAKDSAAEQTFVVQKIKKDYGPCTPTGAPTPAPAPTQTSSPTAL